MKHFINVVILLISFSCGSNITDESAFTAISNANQQISRKLSGLNSQNKLDKLVLKDIVDYAKPRSDQNKIFSRFLAVLEESSDIVIYPRESSYVMCMKWSDHYKCDLSSCMGIEYEDSSTPLQNPQDLTCVVD